MTRPVVYLALPHRNDFSAGTLQGVLSAGSECDVVIREKSCSLLPFCFNHLWCDALNNRSKHGLTHFAMMHCDIWPAEGWLDTLLKIQRETTADIVSAIVPIKDERGLTSTAFRNPITDKIRRLTMTEVHKLPATFDADQAGFAGHTLLVNTGLWICDFTQQWVEKMCFREQDGIERTADGMFRPLVLPEDWIFSLDANEMGLKSVATRTVDVKHKGEYCFPNSAPWGKWVTDQDVEIASSNWQPCETLVENLT